MIAASRGKHFDEWKINSYSEHQDLGNTVQGDDLESSEALELARICYYATKLGTYWA